LLIAENILLAMEGCGKERKDFDWVGQKEGRAVHVGMAGGHDVDANIEHDPGGSVAFVTLSQAPH
jgi:hypothetical protein